MAKPQNHRAVSRADDGFALVLVLGFVFVVALFVTPFVLQARTTFFIAKNQNDANRLEFLAEGLVQVIGVRILNGAGKTIPLNGTSSRCQAGSHHIVAAVQNHAGLIDVNAASPLMMEFGFKALGYDAASAALMAQIVLRSRSIQTSASVSTSPEVTGGLRHRPYLSVSELSDIRARPGLSNFDAARIFTVRSRTGQLNTLAAPPVLVSAIGANQQNDLPLTAREVMSSGIYTIRVTVKSGKADLRGSAHRIVGLGAGTDDIRLLESIPSTSWDAANSSDLRSCDELFGAQVAQILQDSLK